MDVVKDVCTVIPVVLLTAATVLATAVVMGLSYLTLL
jgi:hypothetical protein